MEDMDSCSSDEHDEFSSDLEHSSLNDMGDYPWDLSYSDRSNSSWLSGMFGPCNRYQNYLSPDDFDSENEAESDEADESIENDSDSSSDHSVPQARWANQYLWANVLSAGRNPLASRKPGLMSYPAPLQLQCLLFIIGHIFEPGDDPDIPITSLALLPRSIRIQLLLHLPAVDVCKLECTSVTADIIMDEIWETLFKKRIPSNVLRQVKSLMYMKSKEITSFGMDWKEYYFNTIYLISEKDSFNSLDVCDCEQDHFLESLLYSVNGLYDFSSDVVRCFDMTYSQSIHGVFRCSLECRLLTTKYHYDKFITNLTSKSTSLTLPDIIDILVDCQVSLKLLEISHTSINILSSRIDSSAVFLDKMRHLLQSLEAVSINYSYKNLSQDHVKVFLDIIFVDNKCPIKFFQLEDYHCIVCPYLLQPDCKVKELVLNVNMHNIVVRPASVFRERFSDLLCQVLDSQTELEKLDFCSSYFLDFIDSCRLVHNCLIQSVGELLHRPGFKHLNFSPSIVYISSDVLYFILSQFFISPYPVSIRIHLSCLLVLPLPGPFAVNPDQALCKSLIIEECTLSPNLASIFPQLLVLKVLSLKNNDWNIIQLFASLQSIVVDSFVLATRRRCTESSISDIVTLFHIVTARDWQMDLNIDDNAVDALASALPIIGNSLTMFHFIYNESNPLSVHGITCIFEALFQLISHSKPPYLSLKMSSMQLTDEIVSAIVKAREKLEQPAIKLKRFIVYDVMDEDTVEYYANALQDIAVDLDLQELGDI